jgi:3-oxoadipate enol-lactonase
MPLQLINGQWINYEDTGGHLGPVVLAHGLLMDQEMFAPQIEALDPGCRVITWDARCHGLTETTRDPFTYWDLADDLKGLLDHLDIERAVIGGMSQGGSVALRFALQHPERVSALILIATHAGIEDARIAAIYAGILDAWESDGLDDQLAEKIAALVLGSGWTGREEWIAKWRQWPRSLLHRAFQTHLAGEDIQHRLGGIKAPALVIHGTADGATPMERAQKLCSDLSNSQQLVVIEGGGHACNLTHPDLVNRAVGLFLVELALKPVPS